MRVGVPKETAEGERRVALVPDVARSLAGRELEVVVERGAGTASGFPDAAYEDAWGCDVVVHVAVPSPGEIAGMRRGQVLIGHLAPLTSPGIARALAEAGVTSFAME